MTTKSVLVAIVAIGLIAWWWPRLAGHSGDLNIMILGDGQYQQSRDVIERRVREQGLSVRWVDAPTSWCEAAAALPGLLQQYHPRKVVVSFAAEGACAQGVNAAARAVGETALIVQLQPGVQPDGLISALQGLAGSATVVDPSNLLSPQGTEAACMWWDECGPNGLVTIRADDTTLTPVGAQRVARALTAILS